MDDGRGIGESIKQQPDRYEIFPYSDSVKVNDIFTSDDGRQVVIVAVDYPKQGLCVADLEAKVSLPETAVEQLDDQAIQKLDNLKELNYKELNVDLIDSLIDTLGAMTIRRMRSVDSNRISIIEFSEFPFVFKDSSLELCLQKLIRFALVDIFDLIEVIKDNKLRSGIKRVLDA